MTTSTSLAEHSHTSRFSRVVQRLNDLSIGRKLSIGFGTLVLLIGFLVFLSYLASIRAKGNFERVTSVRLPSALNSLVVELEMYEMIANVQGYLSLGEARYRESYEHDTKDVEDLLHEIESLAVQWNDQDASRDVTTLHNKFHDWTILVERMFELRDNPIENQPAVRILSLEARPVETAILSRATSLIEQQAQRSPSADNMRLLKVMADFQSTFNLMTTALDGYIATLEPDSKELFQATLIRNETAWNELNQSVDLLTPEQQFELESLEQHRASFLKLPDRMFAAVEGERAREDLFLLRTQAAPLADEIIDLFHAIRSEQLYFLATDISTGNNSLSIAQTQTIVGAAISVVLAAMLAFAIRRNITGPVMRLTEVTTKIMQGDLDVAARMESKDEIGRLAESFNNMTDRLKETLAQAERRAGVIETSSRISQRLSTILYEEQLISEVVEQLQTAFGYSHAHLFLVDETNQDLVFASGSGEVGQELSASGFRVSKGNGLVGKAATLNRPVLITDVQQDKDYLANPLLSETKSELAVPISIGAQVLGVLDVQHDVAGGLTQVDADLLQSIASQTAITLRNARAYAETQQRADQERMIYDINQKILSASTVEMAMQIAVRELGRTTGTPLTAVSLTKGSSIKAEAK